MRSMKIDTMNCACGLVSAGTTSRHGTTPMMDRFIARYRRATATTLIAIDRGNHTPRVLHLVADVADVVVAEVIVDRDPRGGAEAKQKPERERERVGWKIERHTRIEVKHSRHDDGDRRHERPNPQRDRDRRDRIDPPIQQQDVDDANRGAHRDQAPWA